MKSLSFSMTVFLSALLASAAIYADSLTGFGKVAENLMSPVGLASDFVYSACIIIGVSFVFAGIIKYFEHRRSPLMVPISTVIFLLVAGIVLLLLPLLSYLNPHGTRYSLFR